MLLPPAPPEAAADRAPRGAGSQRAAGQGRTRHCLQRSRLSHCEQSTRPALGSGETGRRGCSLQRSGPARTAMVTFSFGDAGNPPRQHSPDTAGFGSAIWDNGGQRRHPHAHDSTERHEGLPGLRRSHGQGRPPRRSPTGQRLWGLPPPRHSTSELEAVPAQLLRILCPKPRSVRVCFLSIPDAISELPRHFTLVTFDSDLSECFSSPEKPVRAPALSDSVEGEGS